MRIAWGLAVCAALLALAGCDPESPGTAARTPATSERPPAGPDMYGEHPPVPGQCLDLAKAAVLDCAQPHDAEVINVGKLTATTVPDEAGAATLTMPACRQRMTEYLGGPDADATNLVAMPLWPNEEQWRAGQRWLLCTVAELGVDEQPVRRTGSLEGALRAQDKLRFQTCSVSSPSREAKIRRGPCDESHLGEALPTVISLGRAGDPMPPTDTINALAQRRCPGLLSDYLGGKSQEVLPSWRLPNAEAWARGYTNLVCYAEAVRPVKVRLRNLGSSPLPG